MRADMSKVLTERPRHGHARSYHNIRQRHHRGDIDTLPTQEGIRRPHVLYDARKDFSDLLGPLRRFLWSSRGRRWNLVWSEICSHLADDTTGAHLKVHVLQEVTTKVVLADDGKVYEPIDRWHRRHEVDGLYVHPVTGLICGDHVRPWWKSRRGKTAFVDGIEYDRADDGVLHGRDHARKIIGTETEAVCVAGVWYWVTFATVPAPSRVLTAKGWTVVTHERTDIVSGQHVRAGRYRAGKRQMCARDLRLHGLVNVWGT